MKKVVSCAFNIDTASVEVKYADGSMIPISIFSALSDQWSRTAHGD